MPTSVKLIFTVGVFAFLVPFLWVVNRGDAGRKDAHFWRGGEKDGFRLLFMRPDGTFRRYTKPLTVAYLVAFLAVIWWLL